MKRIGDLLARMGDAMVRPFAPFLIRVMEARGLIRPIERIVEWLARRLR